MLNDLFLVRGHLNNIKILEFLVPVGATMLISFIKIFLSIFQNSQNIVNL